MGIQWGSTGEGQPCRVTRTCSTGSVERDAQGLSRTDALIWAAHRLLEQFRPMLDSSANIKSVHLDLRITSENKVHHVSLAPRFETNPERPDIGPYKF